MLDRYLDTLQAHNTRIIGKQTIVTLTTTGTNVAATFTPSTGALNIPNYALGALYNSNGTLTSARTISSGGFPLTLSGTNIASSGVSRGFNFTNTLQAAANNDVLTAIDIAPTFTNGAFTNVRNYGIRSGADIAFTNTANRSLTVQQSSNTIDGRTLTINGGSANSTGTGNFDPLLQTGRTWLPMAAAPNGNVYAAEISGDIYMQTNGTGNFVALSQTNRNWYGIVAAPNGNVYAAVQGGDIYMQTNGTGNFVALSQTSRNWYGMAAAPNGNVYAAVQGGDIYMQTNGTGNFVALSQTSRQWTSMSAAPNGNVYAAVNGGDIYMQTNGTGNFVALSQTSRQWAGIVAAPNGNVYASVYTGDIYMQTNGTGNFVALSQGSRQWVGMSAAPNNNVYAAVLGGDIYMQADIAGTPNLNGGSLILTSGAGKGTGTSTISFQTGTTLDSSTTLQTLSTKMTILGNGNVGIGTTTPNATAKLDISDTAKGILIPRMTTAQRDAISSPAAGLSVYNTTLSTNDVKTAAAWYQQPNGLTGSDTLDFPSTGAHSSADLTITVTGAADGDMVILGVPNASVTNDSNYSAWVSAANTVTVRYNHYGSGTKNPASGTFKVYVIKN
jgi:ABC-type Fe3+-hydroxamate transport system substrate-binding protein